MGQSGWRHLLLINFTAKVGIDSMQTYFYLAVIIYYYEELYFLGSCGRHSR